MERSPSGVGPALALCLLLLALSAPGPAEGRLLKGAGAAQAAVGAGAPQEPFFLRILKGLLAPQQPLTPQVDAPGDSTRPASTAGGAGIMASGSAKTKQNACDGKVCKNGLHCLPRKHRGHWWGKCVCRQGFRKPLGEPNSLKCVRCCECLSGSEEPSPKCAACGRFARCTSPGQPTILPRTQAASPPTPTLTPTLALAPAPTELYPGGNTGGQTHAPAPFLDIPPPTGNPPPPPAGGTGTQEGCNVALFTEAGCKRAQDTVDLVNAFRVTQQLEHRGLRTLCLSNKLMASAKRHAEWLQQNWVCLGKDCKGFDLHAEYDNPARNDGKKRMNQEGFYGTDMAENAAKGYGLPRGVVISWEHSSGHRANMLLNASSAGVWKGGDFWIMDLGHNGKEKCNPYVQ